VDAPDPREAGRSDDPETLKLRLPGAPAPYLEGAAQNPALTEETMLLLLGNRAAPAAMLGRIARNWRWTRVYAVKLALIRNPRTPYAVARGFLGHLYWRDLLETSGDLHASPVLRRDAEKILRTRLPELSVGEKVTLARRASRGLVEGLLEGGEGTVLRALLGNPRLTEREVVRIAASPSSPADALAAVAGHHAWGIRRDVRLAVLANPRTPVAAALRLVETIPFEDLGRVAADGAIPRIVRVGAARRLDRRGSPPDPRPELT
jgi:hypothetical protein